MALVSESRVVEAVALDGSPAAELWRFLLDIDWSMKINADLLLADHSLRWLLAMPRRMKLGIGDGLRVRLVDVGAAVSARTCGAERAVVVDMADAFCLWNAGAWRIANWKAHRTSSAPRLRACALGSVYRGGPSSSQLVGGRVEELRPDAAARTEAMSAADRAPSCAEIV